MFAWEIDLVYINSGIGHGNTVVLKNLKAHLELPIEKWGTYVSEERWIVGVPIRKLNECHFVYQK